MAISISGLPKHLAPRLGKQMRLEATLVQCLPAALQALCTFTFKDGQVTVRQFALELQQCLCEHFQKFSTTPIQFKVTPKADSNS
jgi:hypothetical protein